MINIIGARQISSPLGRFEIGNINWHQRIVIESVGLHRIYFEQATKLKAKMFISMTDPTVAESWMIKIERVFDVMGCPDDRKLRLVTFWIEGIVYY